MYRKENTNLFSTLKWLSAFTLVSGIGVVVYKLYQNLQQFKKTPKVKKDKLNPWLEEYINEISDKIKNKNDNPLSIETISSIFNLIAEIEDYLYTEENTNMEEHRINLLNTKEYEEAVLKTIELRETSLLQAYKIIENRLKVDIEVINSLFQGFTDKTQVKELLQSTKKAYLKDELPRVDTETVKKAYMYYTSQLILHDKVEKNNINLCKVNPEFREVALNIYFVNKYIIKDSLKSIYGIEEKYFSQLLRSYDLNEDVQVKVQMESIKNI